MTNKINRTLHGCMVIISLVLTTAMASQDHQNNFAAITQLEKLFDPAGQAEDFFGQAISVDGDRMAIGANQAIVEGDRTGAVYVFEFDGSNWQQMIRLTAAEPGVNDGFGKSVSLEGDRLLVGAPAATDGLTGGIGAFYVFEFDGTNWLEMDKLHASDKASFDLFGNSVSLSGDRALIGAHRNDDAGTSSGSAYVFEFDGTDWTEMEKLTAADAAAGDSFGFSVALEANTAFVAAHLDHSDTEADMGTVYVFDLVNGDWVESQALRGSDTSGGDQFGYSIRTDNNQLIVGAPRHDAVNVDSGAAYVFQSLGGSSWLETGQLLADDGVASDYFGWSVAISGNRTLVGAFGNDDDGISSGSAYGFYHNGDNWVQSNLLLANDGTPRVNDQLGNAVALSAGTAVVGAYKDDAQEASSAHDSGAAYVFDIDLLPSAVDDAATGIEDDDLVIDVTQNDTDSDGGPMIIVGLTQPDFGTASVQNNEVVYTPADDYCNDNQNADQFSYELNGGAQGMVQVTVVCVNDAPSFAVTGDVLAANNLNDQNQLWVDAFAFDLNFGPADEDWQQVLDFHLTVVADTNAVIQDIDVNDAGQLFVGFTANYGSALVQISMQDNGGTANQGDDTSGLIEFMITRSDLIFLSGFEGLQNLTNLNAFLLKIQPLPQPIYNPENDNLAYMGHTFSLRGHGNSQLTEQRIIEWMTAILVDQFPLDDFDGDGLFNAFDATPVPN
ncbi:Ig-like domain-containing protein [Marinicella sediminis]|uniref:Ig-like domain-containing protein n=1 Tax=Marinicella sediminis TaxID=1792834 RepID=A0ABV7J3A3_9GAMM|nr:Ig-like domain-containing protein [Marinicella sediminis]